MTPAQATARLEVVRGHLRELAYDDAFSCAPAGHASHVEWDDRRAEYAFELLNEITEIVEDLKG